MNARAISLLTMATLVGAGLSAGMGGCQAEVTEGCATGPCEPRPSTGGAGGAGGTGGMGGVGGSGGAACPPTIGATGELPCDVAGVLTAWCTGCHGNPTTAGAPFPLLTYEDLYAEYYTLDYPRWMQVKTAVHGDTLLMPQGGPMLPAADLDVLDAWFEACAPSAPEGMGCDGS